MNTHSTHAAQAQHTPGPWIATEWHDIRDNGHGFDVGGHPDHNAGLSAAVYSGPDCAANARLIAAAPELLEALERTMNRLECVTRDAGLVWREWSGVEDTLTAARAAIAKARGQ